MNTQYELQKHVEDALYKRRLLELLLEDLKRKYALSDLTYLSNLKRNKIDKAKQY
jgi:hypothetical protein